MQLDDRWRYVHKNWHENLNRVGGPPSWQQDGDYPEYLKCKGCLRLLAQLDSGSRWPTIRSGWVGQRRDAVLFLVRSLPHRWTVVQNT